jgi:hypothetical protein
MATDRQHEHDVGLLCLNLGYPTAEEVEAYCRETGSRMTGTDFYDTVNTFAPLSILAKEIGGEKKAVTEFTAKVRNLGNDTEMYSSEEDETQRVSREAQKLYREAPELQNVLHASAAMALQWETDDRTTQLQSEAAALLSTQCTSLLDQVKTAMETCLKLTSDAMDK